MAGELNGDMVSSPSSSAFRFRFDMPSSGETVLGISHGGCRTKRRKLRAHSQTHKNTDDCDADLVPIYTYQIAEGTNEGFRGGVGKLEAAATTKYS